MQVFLTLWAGGFFGGLSSTLLGLHGPSPFIVCGSAAFFGIPAMAYFGKKLNYGRTRYIFHDAFLEFEEGFFSRNTKVVRYRDMREISLRRGILQRSCNLGTIYLATLATGSSQRANPFYALGFGNISASGVGIRDILDPDKTFSRVRQLVDAASREDRP